MRIRDLSAQYILGTSIIKMNKCRPNLGTYCLANRKGARLKLMSKVFRTDCGV